MFGLFFSKVKFWGLALVGTLGAIMAVYFRGMRDAQQKRALEEAEEYIKVKERLDEAYKPTDTDASREWLRDFSERAGRDK